MYPSHAKPFRNAPVRRTFGIELELEGIHSHVRNANTLSGWVLKRDGSLDISGCEFVSHPESKQSLSRKVNTLLLHTTVRSASTSGQTGLHIHVARNKPNDYELLVNINRRMIRMCEWLVSLPLKQSAILAGRELNSYCNQVKSKYSAINTRHEATWEIRIFQASTNPQWVMRCVDVAEALCNPRFQKYCNTYDSTAFELAFLKVYGYSLDSIKP